MKFYRGFTVWFTGLSGSGKATPEECADEIFNYIKSNKLIED
jgi:adenylylsulfate kinase-like enzyme